MTNAGRGLLILLGIVLAVSVAVVQRSLGFVVPSTSLSQPTSMEMPGLVELREVSRGDVEPPTVMHARYPDRTRRLGGGRLPISINRKPVLAYSIAAVKDGNVTEQAASVLSRLRRMMDTDYVNMITQRQEFFKPEYRKRMWTADYKQRMGLRMKLRRVKERFETAWQQWLRTEGRRQGLTEPVKFNGPKLGMYLRSDSLLNSTSEPDAVNKHWPSKEELKTNPKFKKKLSWSAFAPLETEPGKWNTDADENVFKLFRRPLHKYPYDIGKRGTNHVVRGNVF